MNEVMITLGYGVTILVSWATGHYLTSHKAKKKAEHYKKRYQEMVNQSLYINTNATVSVAKALAKLRPLVDELEKIQNAMPKDAADIARMNMKEEGAYAAVSKIANALLEPYKKEPNEPNAKPPKDYVETKEDPLQFGMETHSDPTHWVTRREMEESAKRNETHVEGMSSEMIPPRKSHRKSNRPFDGTNGNGYQPTEGPKSTTPPGAD